VPSTGVPEPMARGMAGFRDLCCRGAGVEHVSRDVTGLIRSPHKPLQGIDDGHVWDHEQPSRRAMPAAVLAAGGDAQALIPRPRTQVARAHRGRGREVSSLDGPLAPHE
jgi:hypothetical protein